MPNATMKKLIGVGSVSEQKSLLKLLTKLGCVEVTQANEEIVGEAVDTEREYDEATLKLAKIEFADRFIRDEKTFLKTLNKTKGKNKEEKLDCSPEKAKLGPKPEVEFEKFSDARSWEHSVFAGLATLEEYNSEIIKLKAESSKLANRLEQLLIYSNINMKLSEFHSTKFATVMLGTIPQGKKALLQMLVDAFPSVVIEVVGERGDLAIGLICLNDVAEELTAKLTELEFAVCAADTSDVPANLISDIKIRQREIIYRREEITKTVCDQFMTVDFLSNIAMLRDFYSVELQKVNAMRNMKQIKSTFLFEAWVPTVSAEAVDNKLEQSPLTLAYILRDIEEGECPPTLCLNNSIVTPYQDVTNMFNVPSYAEINPNPFVAFFFILFFGVMISDFGYGVIMTLGSLIVLAIKKPRKNEMSLVKILVAGGISTMCWGIAFGGYFGIDTAIIEAAGIPYWFSPVNDPIKMLALSLGLGIMQMMTGIAVNAYALFKQHKPLDAIFGCFSWYALVIGLAMFALGGSIAGIKYTGIALLAAGLLGLMAAGALHKRGIKKVGGAFGNLYSLVNFFSDLLSYTRLFGLGLATGVIALVFNQIGMVMLDINIVIGVIMTPLILIVGHTFNIGINTLGAYVHNSRLQFVEFFGKFYEGGGYLFAPLGSTMTNYNFTLESAPNLIDVPKEKKGKKGKKDKNDTSADEIAIVPFA